MSNPIDLSEGIGRRDLTQVRRRFMELNRARLDRLVGELRPRQQDYLRLLPLLFHINHPMLPGFVNNETPAGLSGYQPDRDVLTVARGLCRSLQYKPRALRQYPIHALYLMGSVGSIGHTRGSDLDIWLCHSPKLSGEEAALLARKARLLEQWAEELDLEVHFFLMDADKFRSGYVSPLSGESSGSTQHRLLLEEFYRSALLLAGRYPLWWLVPPEREADYTGFAGLLLQQRFVDASECLDFGGLGETRGDEFFGSALWQLYKGIYSPYKSVLKILLIEAYAQDFPRPHWLALQVKQSLYQGDIDSDELDAYLLMYRSVESYLQSQKQPQRLELARRCLYFKVGVALSRPQRDADWRVRIMRDLVRRWGWDQSRLRDLDGRNQWKIDRVLSERDSLVQELNRSYRLLSDFASGHADEFTIDPGELNLLGRKLYTSLEHRPGKVEWVNPGISMDLSEDDLSLRCRETETATLWALHRGRGVPGEGASDEEPVKLTDCLLELLAWCHVNGLAGPDTRFHIQPQDAAISGRELQGMQRLLREGLAVSDGPGITLTELASPPQPRSLLLVVNVGTDPLQQLQGGMRLVSDRSDPLNYGFDRRCLLRNLDLLVHTSWGELVAHHHRGPGGLLDALCFFLDLSHRPGTENEQKDEPHLRVAGFSSAEAMPLARRIELLLQHAHHFFTEHPAGRYVLSLGGELYLLESGERGFHWVAHDTLDGLLDALAEPRVRYSPPACDPLTLTDTPLPAIFRQCVRGEQQLFYHSGGGLTRAYVLDESGSLFRQEFAEEEPRFMLMKEQRFLESLARLRRLNGVTDEAASMITGPRFYRMEKQAKEGWRVQPARLPRQSALDDYLELVLMAESDGDQVRVLSLLCGTKEFNVLGLGERLFDAVVARVLAYRNGGDYPIYLTSVELIQRRYGVPPSGVELLTLKRRVEQRLNQALQRRQAAGSA